MRASSSVFSLLVITALAACGGGGDGTDVRNGTSGVSASGSGGMSGAGKGGMEAGSGGAGTTTAGGPVAGGSAGDGGGGGGDDILPGQICEKLSTIQCMAEAACCDNPGRTMEQCKTDMKTGCSDTLHLDEIAMDAITGFDAAAAKAAFAHFEELAAACDPTIAEWGASDTGLRTMLAGTVAPGGSCPIRANATPQQGGAALASCTGGATTACMFHGIGGVGVTFPINWSCDARAGQGAACFTDANCTNGLYCDNPDAMFDAQCKPRKAVGETCANPNECATLFCKNKLCVATDKTAAYCLKN